MPGLDSLLPEVVVESVSFSEHALQITYFERADLTEYVTLQRALLIDVQQVKEEVEELQDVLRDLVDKALLLKRNPPKRLKRRPRPVEEGDDGLQDEEAEGESDSEVDGEGGV